MSEIAIETIPAGTSTLPPPEDRTMVLPREVSAQLYANDPFLAMIERAAYAPNFNPDAMRFLLAERQKIIDDQRRMAFNEAFAKAQRQFKPAKKNRLIDAPGRDGKKGQHTHYADWMSQWAAVQEALTDNGLSLWHEVNAAPGQPITITAHLEHSGGWKRQTSITFQHDATGQKNAVQAQVSAVTYGRRVTGMAILNLTAEDDPADDDGAGAEDTKLEVILISPEQVRILHEKIMEAGVPHEAVCKVLGVTDIADTPADKYDSTIRRLEATIKKKEGPAL